MKHREHIALAEHLLTLLPEKLSDRGLRRAFLLGNLLPDYNPFTYLRGIRQSKRMAGHNADYSDPHLRRVIRRLLKKGIRSHSDAYSLGTVIHYTADSFTYPHTSHFCGRMAAHNRYERELQAVFEALLAEEKRHPGSPLPVRAPLSYLEREKESYTAAPHSLQKDAATILRVCSVLFVSFFQEKTTQNV